MVGTVILIPIVRRAWQDKAGETHYVKDLVKHCAEHRLDPEQIDMVASGDRKTHKGWIVNEAIDSSDSDSD